MSKGQLFKAKILGTGHYLPEKVLTNADIEKMVETNDQWIFERTGIRERRIASPEMATSDIALIAAKNALDAAGIQPSEIEMIIVATVTPDQSMPSTACTIQAKLGCGPCVAFDLSAACSGFVFASSVANQYIKTGFYKKILVVGGEVLSRIVNYKDRETCILFGDGAGAAVYGQTDESDTSGILSESLYSDGRLGDLLVQPAGGSRLPLSQEVLDKNLQFVTMKGREIFKNAVRTMSRCAKELLTDHDLSINDVQWVIPHQANQRIIEAVAKQMDIPMSKIIMNLERTGNTSAGSVPIALDEAIRSGQVKRGDMILITVFGAGLTSGGILLRY